MFKTHVESCLHKTVEILKYLNWGCFTHFLEILRYFSKNLLIVCSRYSTLDCDNHLTRLKGLNCCTHPCQQNAHLKAWCGYDLKAWHPSDVLAWCGLAGWMDGWMMPGYQEEQGSTVGSHISVAARGAPSGGSITCWSSEQEHRPAYALQGTVSLLYLIGFKFPSLFPFYVLGTWEQAGFGWFWLLASL
jgi:hypothetical protein